MNAPPTKIVLALMAHPDDAEFLCGGTLALLAESGWEVHIATAAIGDCGSATLAPEEIAAIRREEAKAAAALLGGSYHCLGAKDLLVFYDETMVRRANALVRKVRPDIVFTNSPADYMPDHEQASYIARAASFNAPVPNAPVAPVPDEPGGEENPAPRIPHLYYADPTEGKDPLGKRVVPDFCVDITRVMDKKAEMLAKHASQREWLRKHHGMDEYIESMRRWAAQRGKGIGTAFAEGFRQHRGHAFPQDDALRRALGSAVRAIGDAPSVR